MRLSRYVLCFYLAGSIIFFAWDQWQGYRHGMIGGASIVTNGIFLAVTLALTIYGLYRARGCLRVSAPYVAILILISVSWALPRSIERTKMIVWANIFQWRPEWCQSRPQGNASIYICYHYLVATDFSGGGAEQWLVIDHTGTLKQPQASWPDGIKRLFVGGQIKIIPESLDCIYGDVTTLQNYFYWVSNTCSGSRLQ